MVFPGIEKVDPEERQRQQALTEALWAELEQKGVSDGSPGQIECYFFAEDESRANALLPAFKGWQYDIADSDDSLEKLVRVVSPRVHLSKEAFLGLLDVSLFAAYESACRFDGFQVDVTSFQKKPWWKFWQQ